MENDFRNAEALALTPCNLLSIGRKGNFLDTWHNLLDISAARNILAHKHQPKASLAHRAQRAFHRRRRISFTPHTQAYESWQVERSVAAARTVRSVSVCGRAGTCAWRVVHCLGCRTRGGQPIGAHFRRVDFPLSGACEAVYALFSISFSRSCRRKRKPNSDLGGLIKGEGNYEYLPGMALSLGSPILFGFIRSKTLSTGRILESFRKRSDV